MQPLPLIDAGGGVGRPIGAAFDWDDTVANLGHAHAAAKLLSSLVQDAVYLDDAAYASANHISVYQQRAQVRLSRGRTGDMLSHHRRAASWCCGSMPAVRTCRSASCGDCIQRMRAHSTWPPAIPPPPPCGYTPQPAMAHAHRLGATTIGPRAWCPCIRPQSMLRALCATRGRRRSGVRCSWSTKRWHCARSWKPRQGSSPCRAVLPAAACSFKESLLALWVCECGGAG